MCVWKIKNRRISNEIRRNFYAEIRLSLANGAESSDLLGNLCLDSFETGVEELSGVEALALKVLALFDVLSGSFLEYQLPLVKEYMLWNVPSWIFMIWEAIALFIIRLDGAWNGGDSKLRRTKHDALALPMQRALWQTGSDMEKIPYEANGNSVRQISYDMPFTEY